MADYIERTEELVLAMNAGARAIENTKRYHGTVYTKDVFSESPQEIPYLQAAKVLRETSDAPAAHAVPVVHGRREDSIDEWFGTNVYTCSKCRESYVLVEGTPKQNLWHYCPQCGARMDGDSDES